MDDVTTNQTHRLVPRAQEEAHRLGRDQIGTEHLLLGLLHRHQPGGCRSVFDSLRVSYERAHEAAEAVVGRGTAKRPVLRGKAAPLPLTQRAEWIMMRARLEAKLTGHSTVESEHVMLALLREDGGEAAKVLDELKLNREEARRRLLVRLHVLPYPGPTVLDGFGGDLDTRLAALREAKDEALDNRDFSRAVELRQGERKLLAAKSRVKTSA